MRRRLCNPFFAQAEGQFTWFEECIDNIFYFRDLVLFSVVEEDFDKTVQNLVFLFFLQNALFDRDPENITCNVSRLSLDWDLVGLNINLYLLVNFLFLGVFIMKQCLFVPAQEHLELPKIHA
jgi:hypothetical protein